MSKRLHTFNSLPLLNFIEIDETGDLTYLQKNDDDEFTIEELSKRWLEILQKFSDATKGNDAGELFSLVQEGRGLHKINALRGIYALWNIDNEYCLKYLKELQVNVKSKSKLYSRIQNEINLFKMRKKQNETGKEGKKTNWMQIVSGFARMTPPINIDINSTTLAVFCGHLVGVKKK